MSKKNENPNTESLANSVTFRELSEGLVKKGGVNTPPTSQRPSPPPAQPPAAPANTTSPKASE